jgi:23S rRNA (cytosine1962-C5)-methyltransferase
MLPIVTLKPGRDKPVRNRHPWVFSGATSRVDRQAANGSIVDVRSAAGEWLARGYLNRRSQIQVRLLTWVEEEAIDEAFWRRRLQRALDGRQALADDPATTAYRLVHGESDGLPGLIVDRYGESLVMQSLTVGIEAVKPMLIDLLNELLQPAVTVERSDVDVRAKEGLAPMAGVVAGPQPGEAGLVVEIREHGQRFLVDLLQGQKTGFYLDQRENRRRVAGYCRGARVLNGFGYTGGFAVYALAGGASHVTSLDSSLDALELAERNLQLNGFDPDGQADSVCGDVFQVLRAWRAEGQTFDAIILDPPKFVHKQAQIERAARAYKDINLLGMQLLRAGGILATFSCSGLVTADLFQKIVFGASVDAGRDAQIVERLSQGTDHPVLLSFPEGEYLKGLICRVW